MMPSLGLPSIREDMSNTAAELQQSTDRFLSDASPAEESRQIALQSEPVVLRLHHIGKSYPIADSDERVVALKDITLDDADNSTAEAAAQKASSVGPLQRGNLPLPFAPVRRGEFIMIRGPSGGGKTTLLNIIGTIDSCTEGTIELNGRIISKDTKEHVLADIRLKSLGFVFQTFNLIATMTAAENVELPMTLLGNMSPKNMRLRSRQLLTLVGLRNRINHLPSELSGGEQQRVTIARSLANNPSLLLLDEPTGDLDTTNTIEVMDLLMRINRRTKTTCIMVTHNPDIECYADRILYVSDGRFVKEVFNTLPTCLNLEAYTKYLAAKEKMITGLNESGIEGDSDPDTVMAAIDPAIAGKNDRDYENLKTDSSRATAKTLSEMQLAHFSVRPAMSLSGTARHPGSPVAAMSPTINSAAVPSVATSLQLHREEREAHNEL
ncbi:putative ABC transporter [Leishmania utingensis]|uniref:ABC transporter n=1 Tax=Leishmania utingensis TaxID=653362 RepID=A0AAW3A9V6_9TRYP